MWLLLTAKKVVKIKHLPRKKIHLKRTIRRVREALLLKRKKPRPKDSSKKKPKKRDSELRLSKKLSINKLNLKY